jgi:branched-chain amino acid transport system ATP-binding protein
MPEAVLEVKNLTMRFGGLTAVKNLSFQVFPNEIIALIGPNGAGKTTVINCITGVYRATAGRIFLKGCEIQNQNIYDRCRQKIGRTFQIPRPFLKMTVLENTLVGCFEGLERAEYCLSLVGLLPKKSLTAYNLTFHELRKLELARALAVSPELLLLDEAIAGLTASETEEMLPVLDQICKNERLAILWVEHVMRAVMETAGRIVVMHQGEKLMEGLPQEVANDEKVIDVYLGEEYTFCGKED